MIILGIIIYLKKIKYMKKLPKNFHIEKYGVSCRFVTIEDAEFILKLRTDHLLSKYIHKTSNDLGKQIKWISEYKEREALGLEYYFIFEKNNSPLGLNRIYNISGLTFTTGSWVFDKYASFEYSIISAIITRDIAFYELMLEFENGFDGCHIENKKVLRFNKMIGLKETGRVQKDSGEYVTMSLTKNDYNQNRPKICKLIGIQ